MTVVEPVPVGFAAADVAVTEDGAVWFVDPEGSLVGRREPGGSIATLDLGAGGRPVSVAPATSTEVWIACGGGRLLLVGAGPRILTEVAVPTSGERPAEIVALPDGTTWLAERSGDVLARVDVLGRVDEFPLDAGAGVVGLAASGDSIWFAQQNPSAVGRIRGGDAVAHLIPLPAKPAPAGLAVDDAGVAWAAMPAADAVARLDRSGGSILVALPDGSLPSASAALPGGGVVVALAGASAVARLLSDGTATVIDLPPGTPSVAAVAVSPNGVAWVAFGSGH